MRSLLYHYITVALLSFCFLTSARSKDDVSRHQDVLGYSSDTNTMRLTVRGKADVHRTADMAEVDFSIIARAASMDEANKKVQSSVHKMEAFLNTVEKEFGGSDDGGAELVYTSWYTQHKNRKWMISDEPGEEHQSEARITTRFGSVVHLNNFRQNISNDPSVDMEWVDWKLSEKTLASVTNELRHAAVADALKNGQDWAKTLDRASVKLLTIEDDGIWSQPKSNKIMRRGGLSADEDVEAAEMEVQQTVQCVFQVIG